MIDLQDKNRELELKYQAIILQEKSEEDINIEAKKDEKIILLTQELKEMENRWIFFCV